MGTHELLSDWDFAVETSDFEALAQDLPALVESRLPLRSRTPTPHRFIELAKIRTAPLPMYSNPPAKLQRIGQFITHHEDVSRGHRSFYLEAPRRIASLEACLVPSRPDALRDAEDSASRRPRPEYAGKGNALPEGLVALATIRNTACPCTSRR